MKDKKNKEVKTKPAKKQEPGERNAKTFIGQATIEPVRVSETFKALLP